MPNIVVTDRCNRRCSYCFAAEAMGGSTTGSMGWPDLVEIVDRVVASGRRSVGVLGGEPGLSEHFVDFLRYLLMREVQPKVFTNGLWSSSLQEAVYATVDGSQTKFIVNVNHPGAGPPGEYSRQRAFLRRFARFSAIGYNLHRVDRSPLFLVEMAREADLRDTNIRLGLAQPISGAGNDFLALEDYRVVASEIVDLQEAAWELGLRVSFDCGFLLCAFTDEQLGRLRRYGAGLKFYCSPAVDCGSRGEAWACYPLSSVLRHRPRRDTPLSELGSTFARQQEDARARGGGGVLEACQACDFRLRKLCAGGCLAHLPPSVMIAEEG